MARKRDYAAEYARRQARARAAGFTSLYAQRVRGGALASPLAPRPSGEELAQRRGHRSYSDLIRSFKSGDLITIDSVASERNAKGQWTRVVLLVLSEDNRTERAYTLSGRALTPAALRLLIDRADAAGAIQSPTYGPARLLPVGADDDDDDVEDDDDFDLEDEE